MFSPRPKWLGGLCPPFFMEFFMKKILEKLLERKLKALEKLQSEIADIRSTLESLK